MHEVRFTLSNSHFGGLASGDPSKPLIVALHGWLDNAASFIPLSNYLSDYRLVALDFAGHGLSSHRSADAHYHQLDFVHDLHELVCAQGWQSFILLGHSMGGIVGSMYTACFPEKVSRYITIESFGPMTKEADSSAKQMRESIESRLALQNREAKHPESYESVIRARAMAGNLSHQAAELLVNRNVVEQDGELRWRTDRRLRTISSLRFTEDQAKNFLSNIACPSLAIMGDKGYESMQKRLSSFRHCVKDLQIATCEGGHHLHMDNPEPVAVQIKQFLDSSNQAYLQT